ncbi:hypothetical protein F5Y14DRAFT_416125 [Nemania sp. NC0429]|nr:hypothetical protein F5Y14DRAFT_416125 [Nemania sp. NC0429]
MSRALDNDEPNYTDTSYRSNKSPNEQSPAASQVTIVHDPSSEPQREQQPEQQQAGLSTQSSQMADIPRAPSPPEAPTVHSPSSEEDIYGPERYTGQRFNFPEYAGSTPQPPPSVHFNPATFMMGGMQTDPLVQRDFKDELARAAGTVTPGVSDVPYIRHAIEAITGRLSDYYETASANYTLSDGGRRSPAPRAQTIPQFTVDVSEPAPVRQSRVAVHVADEAADEVVDEPVSGGWQTPLPAPSELSADYQVPVERQLIPVERQQAPVERQHVPVERQQVWVEQQQQAPVERQLTVPTHIVRSRIDEITEQFYRTKALIEQGPPPRVKNNSPPRTVDVWRAQPDSFPKEDLEAIGYKHPAPPPLTHKPWVLRPLSLLLLATLCLLVITALIFSAVYSIGRDGFTAYAGTIYGGQYFVFRVLPQLVGAVLLVYTQCVVAAVSRVFPFSAMASEDRRERRNAVFLPLFSKSFLWPRLFGPWHVWVPTLVAWLANFTIPLLSSLYTVVLVDGVWTWSTVQGVAWALVAIYVSLLLSVVVVFVYWRQRRTGMIEDWDIRSLADIIFLLSQSNSLAQYRGLETAATRGRMEKILDGTTERLGYWTTPEVPENKIYWSFGVPTTTEDLRVEKWDNKNWAARRDSTRVVTLSDVEDQKEPWSARSRYLPWCFRDGPIIFSVVAATILVIALIVVAFIPATDLRNGFLPRLSAAPGAGAFSPADFLYSFVPSLIGLVLFLGFQSLELTLRVLAPWGELARKEGSRAETSLLLDYAACLPWESTVKAIKLRHWRMAFVTFLSPLFVLLPVLGGGLFMALTPPSGAVHMYPNVAIFAVILAFLILYVAALASLVPGRQQFRLPHAVTCLAEIMSFCCNEQLRTDEAFDREENNIYTRHDLEGALDCGKDWHRQGRWTFGAGRNNEERLGIKRHSQYTVNSTRVRQYDKFVRGKPISSPLPYGSGPLFGY